MPPSPIRRIAICTGGGDAPGLNPVTRAVTIAAIPRGWECHGIRDGINGILFPERYPAGGMGEQVAKALQARTGKDIGLRADAPGLAAMNALMLEKYALFIADTYVNEDPTAEQLASIALMAAQEVSRFGLPLWSAAQGGVLVALQFWLLRPSLCAQDAPGARAVFQDGAGH